MKGSVYKRCNCPVERSERTGKRLACKEDHGSWIYVADAGLNPATGKRRQVKKGGFTSKAEAESALAELVDGVGKGTSTHDDRQTVKSFLERWIDDKEANGLRPATVTSYRQHVDQYFVPTLGRLRLKDLRPAHVEAMLVEIAKPREGRRQVGAASVRRIHATLRSALASAVRLRLVPYNAAVGVQLPRAQRPKVQPWEVEDLGAFLDSAVQDTLGAYFETVAGTAGRRGEILGLRWADVDFDKARAVLREQVLHASGPQPCPHCGGEHSGALFGPIKTRSGEDRRVDLDAGLVGVLIGHKLRQEAEKAQWGELYLDHGLVFAREDGTPIPPDSVTRKFKQLVKVADLRAARLHDLRHGRASLLLAAGVDIALVSKLLGHSSIGVTVDTYSHLLEGVGKDAAERATALVPRAPRDQVVTIAAQIAAEPEAGDDSAAVIRGLDGAALGNRTLDLLITSSNEPVTGDPE